MNKKLFYFMICFMMLFSITGCEKLSGKERKQLKNLFINLNATSIELQTGATYTLNATKGVDWYSSDEQVVVIGKNGLIKGKKNGEAVLTVATENQSQSILVKVQDDLKKEVIIHDYDETTVAASQNPIKKKKKIMPSIPFVGKKNTSAEETNTSNNSNYGTAAGRVNYYNPSKKKKNTTSSNKPSKPSPKKPKKKTDSGTNPSGSQSSSGSSDESGSSESSSGGGSTSGGNESTNPEETAS